MNFLKMFRNKKLKTKARGIIWFNQSDNILFLYITTTKHYCSAFLVELYTLLNSFFKADYPRSKS